jgi:hypothetical protein
MLLGHARYDAVIYLFFNGGRGKEKFWVQILHRLSIALHALSAYFGVAICNTGCSRNPQNQYSIRLLAPIDNGSRSFYLA